MRLEDWLNRNAEEGNAPFHMPGHKRRPPFALPDPYRIDVTEIPGADDLHHPEGMLADLQREYATQTGASQSFLLTNGSTSGVLAAVSAACGRGDTVLLARNCHRSVYHACMLRGLDVRYVYPRRAAGFSVCGSLAPEDVLEALKAAEREGRRVRACILTSPTYEGIVSDISALAKICHKRGALLIVDEAHGAHLPFCADSPEEARVRAEGLAYARAGWCDLFSAEKIRFYPLSALHLGADLVVQSLHKTLPALTQCAVLHAGDDLPGDIRASLQKWISVYLTSSPSYVLMASASQCLAFMENEGRARLKETEGELAALRRKLAGFSVLHFLRGEEDGVFGIDPARLYLEAPGLGRAAAERLRRQHHIEPEMVTRDGVTLITTLVDGPEELAALEAALAETDAFLASVDGASAESTARAKTVSGICMDPESDLEVPQKENFHAAETSRADLFPAPGCTVMTIEDAFRAQSEAVPVERAAGRVSADFVYAYPPGIPMLVPGEEISPEGAAYAAERHGRDGNLHGIDDAGRIRVVSELADTQMSK